MPDIVLPNLALARGQVDRQAERRTNEAWIQQTWESSSTLVLPVSGGQVPVEMGDQVRLHSIAPRRGTSGHGADVPR